MAPPMISFTYDTWKKAHKKVFSNDLFVNNSNAANETLLCVNILLITSRASTRYFAHFREFHEFS